MADGDPIHPIFADPSQVSARTDVSSMGQALFHHAIGSVAPTLTSIPGAEAGGEIGATIGAFGGPLDPVTIPGGALLGAGLGGLITGGLGSWAQQQAFDAAPSFARALGQDDETRQIEESEHPFASMAGGFIPQALMFPPSIGGEGALMRRVTGAGMQGGLTAAQNYFQTGQVDPMQVAGGALAGAAFNGSRPLGFLPDVGAGIRAGTRMGMEAVGVPVDLLNRVDTAFGRNQQPQPQPQPQPEPEPGNVAAGSLFNSPTGERPQGAGVQVSPEALSGQPGSAGEPTDLLTTVPPDYVAPAGAPIPVSDRVGLPGAMTAGIGGMPMPRPGPDFDGTQGELQLPAPKPAQPSEAGLPLFDNADQPGGAPAAPRAYSRTDDGALWPVQIYPGEPPMTGPDGRDYVKARSLMHGADAYVPADSIFYKGAPPEPPPQPYSPTDDLSAVPPDHIAGPGVISETPGGLVNRTPTQDLTNAPPSVSGQGQARVGVQQLGKGLDQYVQGKQADINATVEARRQQDVTDARNAVLTQTIKREPTNPTSAFLADLRRAGHQDLSVRPDEAQRIANYEDALIAFGQRDEIPSAPDESDNFGIREKGAKPAPESAAAPEPEPAPTEEPPAAAPAAPAAPEPDPFAPVDRETIRAQHPDMFDEPGGRAQPREPASAPAPAPDAAPEPEAAPVVNEVAQTDADAADRRQERDAGYGQQLARVDTLIKDKLATQGDKAKVKARIAQEQPVREVQKAVDELANGAALKAKKRGLIDQVPTKEDVQAKLANLARTKLLDNETGGRLMDQAEKVGTGKQELTPYEISREADRSMDEAAREPAAAPETEPAAAATAFEQDPMEVEKARVRDLADKGALDEDLAQRQLDAMNRGDVTPEEAKAQTDDYIERWEARNGQKLQRGALTQPAARPDGLYSEPPKGASAEPAKTLEAHFNEVLAKAGLSDQVRARVAGKLAEVVNGQEHNVTGSWNPLRRLIKVAYKIGEGHQTDRAFYHEVMHAVESLGLLSPDERASLVREAKRDPEVVAFVRNGYSHLSEHDRESELIAEHFAKMNGDKTATTTQFPEAKYTFAQRAWQKIRGAMTAVRDFFRGNGYRSAEDIHSDILSGRLAERAAQGDLTGGVKYRLADKLSAFSGPGTPEQKAQRATDNINARQDMADAALRKLLPVMDHDAFAGAYRGVAPELTSNGELMARAGGERDEAHVAGSKTLQRWTKYLNPKERDEVSRLIQAATVEQHDVKTDAGPITNSYNALSRQARDVYDKILDDHKQLADKIIQAMKDALDLNPTLSDAAKAVAIKNLEASRLKIYSPLMRFGDHYITAHTPEHVALANKVEDSKSRLQGLLDGNADDAALTAAREAHAALLKQYDASVAEGGRINIGFENRSAQRKGYKKLVAEGYDPANIKMGKVIDRDFNPGDHSSIFLNTINATLKQMADRGDKATAAFADNMRSMINQAYWRTLPETASLRSGFERSRQAIPGFSTDAPRAYAVSVKQAAAMLAQIKYGRQAWENVAQMEGRAKTLPDNIKLVDAINEEKRRLAAMTSQAHTPVQDFLRSLTSMWTLGLSPSATVMHFMQTGMFTAPMMAARYPAASVARELSAAAAHIGARPGDFVGKEAQLAELFGRNPVEKMGLRFMVGQGHIANTETHALNEHADASSTPMQLFHKAAAIAGTAMHHTERFNRVTTFLTGLQLAMDHPERTPELSAERIAEIKQINPELKGATDQQVRAMDYARQVTLDSHVDYSAANRPPLLNQQWMRLAGQFQNYQFGMLKVLGTNIATALDKGASKQERWVAAKTLGGILMTHGLMTGAMGLPGAGMLAFALNLHHKILGDQDVAYDADDAMRQWANQHMPPGFGDAFARGILYLPGLKDVLPGDITDRLGMGDLIASGDRMGQIDRQNFLAYVGQSLGGPAAGLLGNLADAWKLGHQGDIGKAAELAMPKTLRDFARTYRFMQEGITTQSGNQVVAPNDFNFGSLASQAIGFQPQIAEQDYANRAAVMGAKTELDDRRTALIHEYVEGMMHGDEDKTQAARDEIDRFNQLRYQDGAYPEVIKGAELGKAVMDRRLDAIRLNQGVSLPPKQRAMMNVYSVDNPSP